MRPLAALLVAVALSVTGCDLFSSINDELKAGERELERYSRPTGGKKSPDPVAEADTAVTRQAKTEAVRRAAERWWGSAKSLIPGEKKDPTVIRCELGSGVQFMRESDCQMRGGRVSRS
jgi:hypothetical protein